MDLHDAVRVYQRTGDEFLRMLTKRDGLRDLLAGRRFPVSAERREYLETALVHLGTWQQRLEKDLTAWAEKVRDLDALETEGEWRLGVKERLGGLSPTRRRGADDGQSLCPC